MQENLTEANDVQSFVCLQGWSEKETKSMDEKEALDFFIIVDVCESCLWVVFMEYIK